MSGLCSGIAAHAPGSKPHAPRCRRWAGPALNALIRASIGYFLLEVLRHPDDPRFAGKAIPLRNLVVGGGLSLLFPALYVYGKTHWSRRTAWRHYPFWQDNLYLSIFWLDMAGNSLNLYNRYTHFDLVPHFHGTGALAAVLMGAPNLSPAAAIIAANVIHGLLEAQEYATDVFFGTRNVRGAWDSLGDIAAGLVGTGVYAGVCATLRTAG